MNRTARARAYHVAAHALIASAFAEDGPGGYCELSSDGMFVFRIGSDHCKLRVALAGSVGEYLLDGVSVLTESDVQALGDALDALSEGNRAKRVQHLHEARREVAAMLTAAWPTVTRVASEIEKKIAAGAPFPCPCFGKEHTGDKNHA